MNGDFPIKGFWTPPPPPPPPPSEKCAKLKYMYIHKYSSARTVYWRTQARGKRKYIMRFEIRYFFLEIGLSPSGLTQPQEKSI